MQTGAKYGGQPQPQRFKSSRGELAKSPHPKNSFVVAGVIHFSILRRVEPVTKISYVSTVRVPRDRAVFEAIVDDSRGDKDTLVSCCHLSSLLTGLAERTPLPADFATFFVNPAVSLVRLRFQRPMDRAALETVEAISSVRADSIVAYRTTDEVRSKSPQALPNLAVHFVCLPVNRLFIMVGRLLMIAHSRVCISRIWSTRRVHKIRKTGRAP